MATYKGHNEDSSGNLLLSIGNGMTATVETGSTASQAYTKGAYIFFNNRFCKATTAISSGATLAIGTNLAETSVGAELTSHLRSSDGKEFYFDVKDGKYGYYPSASKTASEFVPFGGSFLAKPREYMNFTMGQHGVFTANTEVWFSPASIILINTKQSTSITITGSTAVGVRNDYSATQLGSSGTYDISSYDYVFTVNWGSGNTSIKIN